MPTRCRRLPARERLRTRMAAGPLVPCHGAPRRSGRNRTRSPGTTSPALAHQVARRPPTGSAPAGRRPPSRRAPPRAPGSRRGQRCVRPRRRSGHPTRRTPAPSGRRSCPVPRRRPERRSAGPGRRASAPSFLAPLRMTADAVGRGGSISRHLPVVAVHLRLAVALRAGELRVVPGGRVAVGARAPPAAVLPRVDGEEGGVMVEARAVPRGGPWHEAQSARSRPLHGPLAVPSWSPATGDTRHRATGERVVDVALVARQRRMGAGERNPAWL
jgi:hypothetical protein